MSLAVARLSNAISRLTLAEHATREWERPGMDLLVAEALRRGSGRRGAGEEAQSRQSGDARCPVAGSRSTNGDQNRTTVESE